MVRSEILAPFYTDLRDVSFEVSYAVYHRRFSTNTLPRWPLAQPMRMLGHNGEINTLLGNLNWAKATESTMDLAWKENANDIKPIVNDSCSDSANLDATLELLVRSGRPITDSLLTLIPEAFRDQPELINKPEILFLDEPTASLDPDIGDYVRGYIQSYKSKNKITILLASHNMAEVERLCDSVIMMKNGKIIDQGTCKEIIDRHGRNNLEETFLKIARSKDEVA